MFHCSKCNRSIGQSVRSCRHRKQGECPLEIATGKLSYPKGQALIMACSGLLFVYFTLSITSAFKGDENAGMISVVVSIAMVSLFSVVGGIVALIGAATLLSKRFIYVDRAAENQATIVTLRGFDYAFETVTSLRLVRFSPLQLFGNQLGENTIFCGVPISVYRNKEALRSAIQHSKARGVTEERIALLHQAAHDAFLNALSGLLFRGLATGKVGELRVSGEENLSGSSREILLLSASTKVGRTTSLNVLADVKLSDSGCTPSMITTLENAILQRLSQWDTSANYDQSKLGPYPTMLFGEFGTSKVAQSIEIVELALRDASFSSNDSGHAVLAWEGFERLYPRLAQATSKQVMQELGLSKAKTLGWFSNFSWTNFRSGFFASLFVLFLLAMYFSKVEQAQKATQFISEHAGKLTKEAGDRLAGKSIKLSVSTSRTAKLQASLDGLLDALTPDLEGTSAGQRIQHYRNIIKRDFSSAKFQREYAHYRNLFSTAFASTNESVRLAAVKTLAAVEGNAAEVTATLEEQLAREPSPVVREAIADALQERGGGGFTNLGGEGVAAGIEGTVNDIDEYINDSTSEAIDDAEGSALDEVGKLLDR